jgi:hypothetical protein
MNQAEHYFRPNRSLLQLAQELPATLANASFVAFLVLALCTPTWRIGPFAWWPMAQFSVPDDEPTQIGLLYLLPVLCVLAWGADWIANRERPRVQWGAATMTLPLLALSLFILAGLDLALNKRLFVQVIGLGLFWFSYLYVLNRYPRLTFPLLVIVVVQASVAVAQFGLQRDLGWAFLGEYLIDVNVTGTSVLWSNDEVWVRGYGLTAHPNVLGGMLAVLLLVLLPQLRRHRGRQQALLAVGLTVGILGLLVSFSRTGWLAFLGGSIYWVATEGDRKRVWAQRAVWLPLLIVPIFLVFYHDLILSRWTHLDTAIEARSIQERVRDAQVALELIGTYPWQGVGAGNGLAAAQAVRADAGTVHNVLLLVMMEIGIVGGVCWLLFMLAPLLPFGFGRAVSPYRPAWIGLLIAGLFDTSLWLTTSWRAALLLGVLAALQMYQLDDRNENA